jgi:hypothetical protein
MQTTATTPTGVPRYRNSRWDDHWVPDTASIALAIVDEAYSRTIEPTVYRAVNRVLEALHALCTAHLPSEHQKRAHDLFRLADDLTCDYGCGALALAVAILRASRETFDPLLTMEENLQRAFAAMGITNAAQATAWGIDRMAHYLPDFRTHFPHVALGVDADEADEAGEDGAACNS